ncbi:MAG: helix-turn-helix transcriptional regulator [Oscillospiraceae bacterium]|nr:helix-turn-helix transcriptional regulator [Oscillospiraceae bacterium]
MSLGENIREKRKALGLTQEELGEALGMAPQTVSKWERDESLPDAALLPQLADALGCSLDRLFGRQTREYMDAATAARDWLLGVRREDRWTEALRLGRIMQTVLAGFWELPGTVSIEAYDDPRGVTGLVHSDEGYSLSAWGKKALPYLLLFPEPGEGWGLTSGRTIPASGRPWRRSRCGRPCGAFTPGNFPIPSTGAGLWKRAL